VFDFVLPGDRAVLKESLDDAVRLGRPTSAEIRMVKASGGLAWVEFRCDPVRDGAWGKDADIVAVGRDTSIRRAYEDQLARARDYAERASTSKSQFLANMSHELRTPLNAIIGFSDVMRQEMFGLITVPKYKEYAGLIHDSGRHLLDLIGDVLDVSKIEAGKYELTLEPVDSVELISKCLETGIGEADLERLGKPFEQASGAYTREQEGTGLGLSLVRSFVELHGGRMEIESALGEGTTVRAFLPMTAEVRAYAEAAE
jgi:signal transduction histidine kinase